MPPLEGIDEDERENDQEPFWVSAKNKMGEIKEKIKPKNKDSENGGNETSEDEGPSFWDKTQEKWATMKEKYFSSDDEKKDDDEEENTNDEHTKEESVWIIALKKWEDVKTKTAELAETVKTKASQLSDSVNEPVLTPTNEGNTEEARNRLLQSASSGYRKEVVRLLISHLDRKKLMSVLFAFEYESTTKRDDTKPFEFSKEKPNERAMKFRLSQRKSNPPMLAELMKTAAEKEQEVESKKIKGPYTLVHISVHGMEKERKPSWRKFSIM